MEDNQKIIYGVIEFIEKNLSEKLSLEDIAKIAGYSKYHLHRMFLSKVGCTIHQYIRKRRLTEAARKLVTTEKTILEIALDCGYETQQSFTFAFTNFYGTSPLIYRKIGEFKPLELNYIKSKEQRNMSKCYGEMVA